MRPGLKILLFTLLGIFLAGLLIPMMFKDKVLMQLKKTFNDQANGTLEFSDLNLSIFKRFPLINLQIENLNITGNESFAQTSLFKARDLDLSFDLFKIIQSGFKKFELKKINIKEPELNLLTLKDERFNLRDIFDSKNPDPSTSTDNSSFDLKLKSISISNGAINYMDSSAMTVARLVDVQHASNGSYQQGILSLDQSSSWSGLDFTYSGISYLLNAPGSWQGLLTYHPDSSLFSLTKNQITLNALVVDLIGALKINSSGSSNWDLEFNSPSSDVKQFVSMIPGAFKSHFQSLQADGSFVFNGSVHGLYDSTGRKPIVALNTVIKNGRIKYGDLPYPIDQIQLDVQLKSLDSFFNAFEIKIPAYAVSIQNSPLVGQLNIRTGETMDVQGSSNGKINLKDLQKAMPIDSLIMAGLLDIDIQFSFTEKLIAQKKYDQLRLKGLIKANDLEVNYLPYPRVLIDSLRMTLDPAKTTIQLSTMQYGRSDFHGSVAIDNMLALATKQKRFAVIHVTTTSQRIDLDEISAGTSEPICDTCRSTLGSDDDLVPKLDIRFHTKAREVNYEDYKIANLEVIGSMRQDSLELKQAKANLNSSDLFLSGTLLRPYRWSQGTGNLTGRLNIQAKQFNLDPWMADSTANGAPQLSNATYIKRLPERTDLNIQAKMDQASYGSMVFKNLELDSKLTNQSFEIHQSTAGLFRGKVQFSGLFQESGVLPSYNFKLDMSNLKIEELFRSSPLVAKLAPLAGFVEGAFSSSLILEGKLNAQLSPIFESFDASGVLETFNGLISKFKPLEDLAQKIQIPVLNFIKWEKSKNWFNIDDGTVTINPFTIRFGDIPIKINGSHRLDQMMNYDFILSIPKKVFEKNKLVLLANEKLDWIRKEAASKGVNLGEKDTIYILFNLQGTVKQPLTKLSWLNNPNGKTQLDQLKDDVTAAIKRKTDSITAAATAKVEQAKDSILNVIQKQIDLKKGQIDSVTTVIRDSLKKVAERKTKQIVDSVIKKETTKILDSAFQSKVDTLLGTKTKEEIDKINEKLKNWNPFKKKPVPAKN